MKQSEINFTVQLDENRVPDKIFWDATENPNEGINETMCINLNIWDQYHKGLLGINLWTKEMPVDEMKHFAVDIIGNLSQMIKDATGDQKIILILEEAGKKITKHIEEEVKSQQQ